MNPPKKVLLITVRSDVGGGPKHVYDLAKNLTDVEVYIASPLSSPYGSLYTQLAHKHFQLNHRKFSLIKLFKLIIFCRRNNINKVHSHGRGAGIYSKIMGLLGFQIIHTFHGVHLPKSRKEQLIILFESLLSFTVRKFISVSKHESLLAYKLRLSKEENTVTIQNGIDIEEFSSIKPSITRNTLGTLTRLDPHKNNLELIKFVQSLDGYKLIIAGDGEEKEMLESYIQENSLQERIKLIGQASKPAEFLSSIDTFVSSSKGEGLPYAVLEAMAAKRIIVASKVSGHVDLLDKSNLYELGNFNSFKQALQSADNHFDMKNFDLKQMAQKVSKLY